MIGALLGGIKVQTTDGRGFTPEELARRAVDKIVYVGSNSHPAVREQAQAFKDEIFGIILFYLRETVAQDRTTLANRLREAGHPELVKLLEI